MRRAIPRAFGSGLLLFGAFAIGAVLHEVLVTGSAGAFSPFAVGGVLVGGVFILVGLRLERRFDPSEFVPATEEEEEKLDEFDEDMTPVSEEMLEGREADDSYDNR